MAGPPSRSELTQGKVALQKSQADRKVIICKRWMAEEILFLTELLGLKVFDLKGRRIGVVKDAAIVPLVDPVRIDRFLVGSGAVWLTIRHDQVKSISLDGIHLRDENLTPYHSDEYVLRAVRDLMDQQIIDAQGRKVVRVNDITFEIRQENGRDRPAGRWISAPSACAACSADCLPLFVVPPQLVRRLPRAHSAALHSMGVLQHSGA